MQNKAFIYTCLAVSCNTITRWLPYDRLYFVGDALGYFFLLIAVYNLFTNRVYKIIAMALCGLAINNLLDELFFDPVHFGYNELFFTIALVIWVMVRIWTGRR